MKMFKRYLGVLIGVSLAVLSGFILFNYYSFIFAKSVKGRVMKVERVLEAGTIIATRSQLPNTEIFSFALSIRDESGEIVTASSEDRQWAVVTEEQCVKAKFFRYPPWDLTKGGTFFGARLLSIYDCPVQQ